MVKLRNFKFSHARKNQAGIQERTVREILIAFDICYKMGVYHAYSYNDPALCRNFLKDCEGLDITEFMILGTSVRHTHRGYRCQISSWIYEPPYCSGKQVRRFALYEINSCAARMSGYNAAIIVLCHRFYQEGVKAFLERDNAGNIKTFMKRQFMDWADWRNRENLYYAYKSNQYAMEYLSDAKIYGEIKPQPWFEQYLNWISTFFKAQKKVKTWEKADT